ncbi:MAG: hypothetical protein JXB05_38105 [Myxococcaceae bacterium]|nr:hypothetical protein [Myxococcaceae bacterium]
MTSLSLKSLLAGAVLLAAPAALADTSTSVPAFEAKIATARTSSSPGGTTVNRAEMSGALDSFWTDDWMVDVDEHAYLGTKLASPTFLAGIDAAAQDFLRDFHELNDGQWAAEVDFQPVSTPASQLFGASGPLANSADIAEGALISQGVANNDTMLYAYGYVLAQGYEDLFWFSPITPAQLVQVLSGSANQQTPSQAEVNGAAAYLTAISGEGERLYLGYWHSYLWGGESAGYVIAAVNEDRDFVRMVRVISWGD